MSWHAEGLGIAIPETWTERRASAWPVVVKARTGCSGQAVRIARTADELARSVTDLSGGGADGLFLQRYCGVETVQVAGAARDGEIVQAGCYRSRPRPADPLGPAALIETLEWADLRRGAATLIADLGYTGIFCLDYVLDDAGQPYFIDFNARAFGSWMALQSAGVDVLGAYLFALGVAPRPDAASAEVGAIRLVPRGELSAASRRELHRAFAVALHNMIGFSGSLGLRWSAVTAAAMALSYARGMLRPHTGFRDGVSVL
jgi:hypothetical protein